MRILLLNQAFPPDVVSTAQHAGDLVAGLAAAGHDVTVIASSRGYDKPSQRFPRRSIEHGATVLRIPTCGLGKSRAWRRAVDFASFLFNCTLRLLVQPRYDVVIAMTSPPLISFVAALFTRLRGGRLLVWVMDLNPDEAIAAGWLRRNAIPTRVLEATLRFSLRTAASIVVLDRFMRDRITARDIAASKLTVIPPWSHDSAVAYDPEGRERFRRENNLVGKFVVMYSGNLSPCHPLNTVLASARNLAANSEIVFCFIGGGSGINAVRAFTTEHGLQNIVCLPYRPLNELSASLSSADLHLIAMGDPFVGIVHPCKIYNVLAIGGPFLYLGPERSHITELIARVRNRRAYVVRHGDVATATRHIKQALEENVPGVRNASNHQLARQFSQSALVPEFRRLIESLTVLNGETSSDVVSPAPVALAVGATQGTTNGVHGSTTSSVHESASS